MPQNTKTHETDLSFSRPTFTEDRFSIANYVEMLRSPLATNGSSCSRSSSSSSSSSSNSSSSIVKAVMVALVVVVVVLVIFILCCR